jgi:hypothetical protein
MTRETANKEQYERFTNLAETYALYTGGPQTQFTDEVVSFKEYVINT